MQPAQPRKNEAASLEALAALEVLDTPPEPEFDALTRAAALICGAPVALVSLVDAERQWFKSNLGLPGVRETPRELAFCAHAVLGDELFEVADARQDARFFDNPLVVGQPNVRFYAGAPIRLASQHTVGTLCVIDHRERQLTDQQRQVLQELASAVARALEGRQAMLRWHRAALDFKQAAVELRHSEARFRVLSEAAPLGVFETDAEGGCIFTNAQWQTIFGLTQTESLGHGWARTLHPQDRDAVFEEWQRTSRLHCDFDMSFRVMRDDGSVRHVRSIARPLIDTTGRLIGHVGSVEDVTKHKLQELALLDSQRLLERTGELAQVGGWELELTTGKLVLSASARRIYGLDADRDVWSGASHEALFAAEVRPLLGTALRESAADGRAWEMELPLAGRLRGHPWVRISCQAEHRDGSLVRLVGAVQDISDTVAKRQQISRSQQRVELATAAGGIGIWEWDLRADQLSWDPMMLRLHGMAAESPAPQPEAWVNRIHPEDRADFQESLRLARETDQAVEHQFRIVWPDLSLRYIRASAKVERDAEGRPMRLLGVNQDVTERMLTQLELRRSNAELEQFAYVASHDLQEPLRMVASYTQLLAQRYKGQLDERAENYIHFAVDGARRMQGLINDLLAYSRVGAQGSPLLPVETSAVVDRVLRDLNLAVKDAQAVIDVGTLPPVLADERQLHQLFQNLVSNALKFRSTAPVRVRIQAERSADRWKFSVRDNGVGLDIRFADRIFQMFQRLHERGRFEGTGIGLAIAKRIVERHDGKIWVESEPGLGSTFCFTLKPVPAL